MSTAPAPPDPLNPAEFKKFLDGVARERLNGTVKEAQKQLDLRRKVVREFKNLTDSGKVRLKVSKKEEGSPWSANSPPPPS